MQPKERKKTDFPVSLPDILNVQRLIYDSNHIVHRSNLTSSNQLCQKYQAKIFLKRQFEQKGKTHKIRGCYYKYVINQADPRSKKGFVCASDGNFAQSLSIIAGIFKVRCVLFIPAVCNKYKLENMKRFGGEYLEFKMLQDCFETAVDQAKQYAETNQMIFMHPFDDLDVITGYTSLAQEIKEDCDKTIDYLFIPSGGGGLLSAIILYFKQLSPETKIVCVEPEGANPMYQSLTKNQIVTVPASRYCDGSSVKQIGQLPFQICKGNVDLFTTVTQGQISQTIIDLYTKGIISEPSGAMSVAALENFKEQIKGKTVVCLISGANTDLSRLDEAQEKSMIFKGFKNYYLINLPNQAGIITKIFDKCLHQDNTITSIQYKRKLNKEQSQFLIGVESKSQEAADFMNKKLAQMNFRYQNINLKENILELLF